MELTQDTGDAQLKCAVCGIEISKPKRFLCGNKECLRLNRRTTYRKRTDKQEKKINKNVCPICGKKFVTLKSNRITCYEGDCYLEHKRRRAKYYRELNGRKPKKEMTRQCKNCGNPFKTNTLRQKYCKDEVCRKQVKRINLAFYQKGKKRALKKKCRLCGGTFKSKYKYGSVCKTEQCMKRFEKEYKAVRLIEKHNNKRKVSHPEKQCPFCETRYFPRNKNNKHCGSDDCSSEYKRHSYFKKKEKVVKQKPLEGQARKDDYLIIF